MSKQNKQSDFADCFISKQAAMQIANELQISVDGYHMYNQAVNNYCAEIGSLPEAIVRCKDCKYMQEDKLFGQYWCKGNEVKPDHFCGYAERRQDGQTN